MSRQTDQAFEWLEKEPLEVFKARILQNRIPLDLEHSKWKQTLLECAAWNGNLPAVQFLLSSGAQLDNPERLKTRDKPSALVYAIKGMLEKEGDHLGVLK